MNTFQNVLYVLYLNDYHLKYAAILKILNYLEIICSSNFIYEIDVMTFNHIGFHISKYFERSRVLFIQNQSKGGSVSKPCLFLVVDLFAIQLYRKKHLIKKDHLYSVLTMEREAMFCEL